MAIDALITDPATKTRARVSEVNESLHVQQTIPDVPKIGSENRYRYFNELLGTTGAGAGTTTQSVDGSVTPVEFYIQSAEDYDINITEIEILIWSNQIANNKFADLTALTIGYDLKVRESGEETFIIEKATTTGELTLFPAGDFVELANWNASNDNARSIKIDIEKAVTGGIRLGRGVKDRLIAVVNDNLTGISGLEVRAIGRKHYPM